MSLLPESKSSPAAIAKPDPLKPRQFDDGILAMVGESGVRNLLIMLDAESRSQLNSRRAFVASEAADLIRVLYNELQQRS